VLAEEAIDLADVDPAQLEQDLKDAREDVADAKTDEAKEEATEKLARLEALSAAKAAG
jgi:F-type H+-transporting ATPase subunit epsilon